MRMGHERNCVAVLFFWNVVIYIDLFYHLVRWTDKDEEEGGDSDDEKEDSDSSGETDDGELEEIFELF